MPFQFWAYGNVGDSIEEVRWRQICGGRPQNTGQHFSWLSFFSKHCWRDCDKTALQSMAATWEHEKNSARSAGDCQRQTAWVATAKLRDYWAPQRWRLAWLDTSARPLRRTPHSFRQWPLASLTWRAPLQQSLQLSYGHYYSCSPQERWRNSLVPSSTSSSTTSLSKSFARKHLV